MRHAKSDSDQNIDPESMLDSWYRNHSSELRAYIFKHLRDRELAEDLLHDTFLVAAGKLEQYIETGQSRAFLYSITNKLMLSAARRRRRIANRQVIGDVDFFVSPAARPLSDDSERQLHHKNLTDALDLLPLNDRKIIELRFSMKLKFEKIADLLNVPMNTAISRLHRAISKIRKQMTRTQPAKSE